MPDEFEKPPRRKARIAERMARFLRLVVHGIAPWLVKLVSGWQLRNQLLALILAVLAAPLVLFSGSIWHAIQEAYGPDVVIGVVPSTGVTAFGARNLLYEFTFAKGRLASAVDRDYDVARLLAGSPSVRLAAPLCEIETDHGRYRISKLVVIAQNNGHKTAKDYEMVVSFSGADVEHADPGVRIVGWATDALRVSYVYQHIDTWNLERCAALSPFMDGLGKGSGGGAEDTTDPDKDIQDGVTGLRALVKAVRTPAREKGEMAAISKLMRATYGEMGLTRDVLILRGTLEAHLFQAAAVLVAVPTEVRKFATLFNIECSDCSHFYRTKSFAQLLGDGPEAARDGQSPM
jgi:hypothetical protein